jgi:cysteine-rich repeat protein
LPGLTPEGLSCKNYLVGATTKLQKIQLKETNSCQKSLDAAKIALPDTAKKCKDADRKGKREKAVLKFQSPLFVGKACLGGSADELDGCGTTAGEFAGCVPDAVHDVNERFAIAAYPDLRCGDAKRIGEECDDGNLLNGDGCADDCTCEGVCGDGVLNPLAVCGELCDDGNSTNGDGCDVNCTPSGCGNQIVAPGEQCERAGDCMAGEVCDEMCLCVPGQ